MANDLHTLLEQIVERALERSDHGGGGPLSSPADDPETAVVELLGDRLAELLAGTTPDEAPRSAQEGEGPTYEALMERNCTLATALGACDCWGEDAACPVCNGAGAPGWTVPDKQLFTALVLPALDLMRRARRAASSEKPRGGDNGRPVRI